MVRRSKKLAFGLSIGVKSFQRCCFGSIAFLDVSSLNSAALVAAFFLQRKKVCFFEKKKQKNPAPTRSSTGVNLLRLARRRTDKSFLVLFFQKRTYFLSYAFMHHFWSFFARAAGRGAAAIFRATDPPRARSWLGAALQWVCKPTLSS